MGQATTWMGGSHVAPGRVRRRQKWTQSPRVPTALMGTVTCAVGPSALPGSVPDPHTGEMENPLTNGDAGSSTFSTTTFGGGSTVGGLLARRTAPLRTRVGRPVVVPSGFEVLAQPRLGTT